MRIRIATFALVFSFISILSSGAVSQADNIKDVLNKANKEGKAVMLELGSVGCIPCEQMKPVMEKLKTTYKGKLEVIFIDVCKDKENGRRFGVTMILTQVSPDKNCKEFHRHIGFYAYEEITPVLKKGGI